MRYAEKHVAVILYSVGPLHKAAFYLAYDGLVLPAQGCTEVHVDVDAPTPCRVVWMWGELHDVAWVEAMAQPQVMALNAVPTMVLDRAVAAISNNKHSAKDRRLPDGI